MKDESVQKLDFSDEFMLESVEKRFQDGNYLGALKLLNKRNKMYGPSADAQALAADIYEAMGLWQQAADAWFRFLDTCNEADFGEGYEGLAVAFMNMGNDVQSALYYHRAFAQEGEFSSEGLAGIGSFVRRMAAPHLHFVPDDDAPCPELLAEGLACLKAGDLKKARDKFSEVPETSSDYPSAAGLSAMCALMLGDEEGAQKECEALLTEHPDNVQALTTYCAVLGAREDKEGARKAARRLAEIHTDATDDLYRIATALCETGLDEEAYEKLSLLKERLEYDDNVLWFHAVAAYKTGRIDAAIESLDLLTTIYPRKAVASYYLERMRGLEDGGDGFSMSYYYRVPEEEYSTIANFLLAASTVEEQDARKISALPELDEFFRIAFDEMEGRDEKLQALAVRVAVRSHMDAVLREVLLDSTLEEYVKISILHELTMRNAEDSFGVVVCNVYREFFTHKIEVGDKKQEAFLKAFADVYAKFALLGDENEGKICAAAEDIYLTLEEAGALDYCDERAALAAAIYREARIKGGERSLVKIVELFDANRYTTQAILDFMM